MSQDPRFPNELHAVRPPTADSDSCTQATDTTEPTLQTCQPTQSLGWLPWLLIIQILVCVALWWIASSFEYSTPFVARPILSVLALLGVSFLLHLISLFYALRLPNTRRLLAVGFMGAISMRGILLFSEPIQEVDIYRYCWDGIAVRAGVSPFRYSPQRVLTANAAEPHLSDGLRRLLEQRDRDPHVQEVLSRVHYGQLTTIYPPVSQLVFAAADLHTPSGASVFARITMMKLWIVFFDVVVLVFLSRMLAMMGQHQAWTLAYGWNPLVLKEFANSGHLDAIAVCWMMASLVCMLQSERTTARHKWTIASAVLLGLSVGAKLYPVLVTPILAIHVVRRFGWRHAAVFSLCCIMTCAVTLLPMLREMGSAPPDAQPMDFASSPVPPPPSLTAPSLTAPSLTAPSLTAPSLTAPSLTVENVLSNEDSQDAFRDHEIGQQGQTIRSTGEPEFADLRTKKDNDGLVAFVSRWEMNDFLFMVIEENLRPSNSSRPLAWFVVIPGAYRDFLVTQIAELCALDTDRVPFLVTRCLTLGMFGCVLLLLLRSQWRASSDKALPLMLEHLFLVLAWFWLLAPTQNPWYWLWALPLVPFARSRIWLTMSGLAMVYYLRFWFSYQMSGVDVWSSGYLGAQFFDLVVVWLEFAPFLLALLVASVLRSRKT